jgi:hypothetical protein
VGALFIGCRRHQRAVRMGTFQRHNRSIVGADLDGYFRITLLTPDRMEKCYTHNATGPSRSVVATCYLMERVRR